MKYTFVFRLPRHLIGLSVLLIGANGSRPVPASLLREGRRETREQTARPSGGPAPPPQSGSGSTFMCYSYRDTAWRSGSSPKEPGESLNQRTAWGSGSSPKEPGESLTRGQHGAQAPPLRNQGHTRGQHGAQAPPLKNQGHMT